MQYEILDATLDTLEVTENEKKYGKKPYKFYLLVDAEDGKKYQVKFNEHKQRNNINEFMAHYMGRCSDMPLLEGAFLSLDNRELSKLRKKLSSMPNGHLKSVDIDMMKKSCFFGIEWKQNTVRIASERELMPRVNDTSNWQAFYALFPFDQFLKNYDRHPGNHLVVQDKNVKRYYLIDFDRLFRSTNWSLIPHLKHDFKPLRAAPYHDFLMHQVDNTTIHDVQSYAGNISAISGEDIKDMCDIIEQLYDVPAHEIAEIEDWMKVRKEEIVMKCFDNERHYPNVTKRGLYSVS